MIYNIEGIVKNQIRDRELLYGYEQEPVIISGTDPVLAGAGSCFYRFRCLGATDAVIAAALDLNGDAVTGLAGVTITAADFPYDYRLSSIDLTSGSIIAYKKMIVDL
jgi:hypothetical protein